MKSSDDHFDSEQWVLSRWSLQLKNMPVNSINGYSPDLPLRSISASTTASASAPPDSSDSTTFTSAAQNQPAASRPDKIARAKELLADGNYPSDKTLNQLAGFLAGKL
ncbi:MAG TPA: hypothetical protein VK742_11585 [Candidatus Sulfotelmatobacter sp.]|jgi:hypothetical protein|nr:hypothetical protein [Candidatus Sulfotelmatobacter sp.]